MEKRRYSIQELERLMLDDLRRCHSKDERGNVEAICGIEIRKRAEELAASGHLTSTAASKAARYGYRS